MTSKTAAWLVGLYPRRWRIRYGQEFAALLEELPLSLRTVTNVLWSAGEAHMQAATSQERNQGIVVGSVWSAWMMAVVAGLILYGMVDDSPLAGAMDQSAPFAASWTVIQAGCVLAASAIAIAGVPLGLSICLYVVRTRQSGAYVKLGIPLTSAFALVAWMAVVQMFTGGHWAASPWAVAFSRPDWPSESVRWSTGSISASLLVFTCLASAASISRLLQTSQLCNLRIVYRGIKVEVSPLSFASALAPWAAAGIFVMLAGVAVWGYSAIRVSATALHSTTGPLGLSGLASWILTLIIFCFAAIISARATWRSRAPIADR
jgi:hypothetical protein